MEKKIVKFDSFEAQELYFLSYYFHLSPLERIRALAALQRKGRATPFKLEKKITIIRIQPNDRSGK